MVQHAAHITWWSAATDPPWYVKQLILWLRSWQSECQFCYRSSWFLSSFQNLDGVLHWLSFNPAFQFFRAQSLSHLIEFFAFWWGSKLLNRLLGGKVSNNVHILHTCIFIVNCWEVIEPIHTTRNSKTRLGWQATNLLSHCCIPKCTSILRYNPGKDLLFHCFPKDEATRNE